MGALARRHEDLHEGKPNMKLMMFNIKKIYQVQRSLLLIDKNVRFLGAPLVGREAAQHGRLLPPGSAGWATPRSGGLWEGATPAERYARWHGQRGEQQMRGGANRSRNETRGMRSYIWRRVPRGADCHVVCALAVPTANAPHFVGGIAPPASGGRGAWGAIMRSINGAY